MEAGGVFSAALKIGARQYEVFDVGMMFFLG